MKSHILHTVWCNNSGEAAGEIWNWSLLGVKGLAYWLEITCFIYIFFSDNDEGSIGHAIEVLKPLAEKHTKSQNEGGADPTLYFLYSTVNEISESLRDFARIPDEDNVLVILDIPSGLVFISDDEELTSDKAGKFISDFLSGKLKGRSLSGKQTCVW